MGTIWEQFVYLQQNTNRIENESFCVHQKDGCQKRYHYKGNDLFSLTGRRQGYKGRQRTDYKS